MKIPSSAKDLIDAYRSGEISPGDFAALERSLQESPALRAYFRSCMHLDTELRRLAESDPAMERAWADKPAQSPPGAILRPNWRKTVSFLALAAAIVALAAFTWMFIPRLMPLGAVVATLSKTSGASLQLNTRNVPATEGTLLHQGRYTLRAGVIEITYPSGAVALLESPANFELRDSFSLDLSAGKLSALVPNSANGFAVNTPSTRIVDIGTEFGVDVGALHSEIHVFKGSVSPVSLRAFQPEEPHLLTEHQASRIDTLSGTPAGIAYDSEKFLQRLKETATAYPKLAHTLHPVAYYRMKPTEEGTLLKDATSTACDGSIVWGKTNNPMAPGKFGAGLKLGGAATQTYAIVPHLPKATQGALSVCAWVLADTRPRWASIAKNWAKEGGVNLGGQFHLGLWKDAGSLEIHVHDIHSNEVAIVDSQPLPLGSWQFVAFTLDGTTLRLYRNGNEVASAPCEGLSQITPASLGIGVKLDPTGTRPDPANPGFWDGRIDELALYHHALSPKDIRNLYEAASAPIGAALSDGISGNTLSNPSPEQENALAWRPLVQSTLFRKAPPEADRLPAPTPPLHSSK